MPNVAIMKKLTGNKIKPFVFSTKNVTLNVSAARREPPSGAKVFTTGVLGTGKADGSSGIDGITYSIGAVTDKFYQTLDTQQGTILFWITPQWGTGGIPSSGITRSLFRPNGSDYLAIYASSNTLIFYLMDGVQACSVNISSWVAGQTYLVIS